MAVLDDQAGHGGAARSAAGSPRSDRLYIAWKTECFRSLQTAYVLEAPLALVHPGAGKGKLGALIRYGLSSLETIGLLMRRRPRVLAVLNQPLPLIVISALYVRLTGAKLVLDGHSKPFAASPASLYGRLYKWVTRTATLTINHNDDDARIVDSWGARGVVFEALPFVLPTPITPAPPRAPYVACVCSFAADEPIAVIMDAVRALAPLEVRITGNWRKSGIAREDFPANLIPTDFLPTRDYYELLAGAAVVVTLSNRDWIMQMAVEEAMLLGVPVVTNFSPVLQKVLADGAAFTTLDAGALAAAVTEVIGHRARYQQAIQVAANVLRERIGARLADVKPLLGA